MFLLPMSFATKLQSLTSQECHHTYQLNVLTLAANQYHTAADNLAAYEPVEAAGLPAQQPSQADATHAT